MTLSWSKCSRPSLPNIIIYYYFIIVQKRDKRQMKKKKQKKRKAYNQDTIQHHTREQAKNKSLK